MSLRFLIVSSVLLVVSQTLAAQEDQAEFRRSRAEILQWLAAGKIDKAVQAVDALLETRSDSLDYHLLHVEVDVRTRRTTRAAEILNVAVTLLETDAGMLRTGYLDLIELFREPEPADSVPLQKVLDFITHHRRTGRVDSLLPLLWEARELAPTDWRVCYALAEAHGVNSPFYDSRRSTDLLRELRTNLYADRVAESIEWKRFCRFVDKSMLEGGRDAVVDFRQKLVEFIEHLSNDEPVTLWEQTDAPTVVRHEELALALEAGQQERAYDEVKKLLQLNPDDVIATYYLGCVRGSLGPKFSKSASLRAFARFLELAAPDRFGTAKTAQLDPAKLAARLRGAYRSDATDMDGIRRQVKRWRDTLRRGKPLLVFADRDALYLEQKKHRRYYNKCEESLAKARVELDEANAAVQRAQADLEVRRRRRPTPRRGARIDLKQDIQRCLDRIQTGKRAAATWKRTVQKRTKAFDRVRARLEPVTERLRQYEGGVQNELLGHDG